MGIKEIEIKETYDLGSLIENITVVKRVVLNDKVLKINFLFPIPLDDTRKLREYKLTLIIEKLKKGVD